MQHAFVPADILLPAPRMSDKPLLHQVLLQLIINLHPSRSGNILAGVHSFLNGLLLR